MKSEREIKAFANGIRNECMTLAPDHADTLRRILFRVSRRMTRAAGKARPATGEVTLSLPYFEDDRNFEAHLRNTVTHEIAHVLSPPTVDSYTGRRSSHGRAWKAMHRRLGGTGDRCHELELAEGYERKTRKRAPRTEVSCPKCGQPMLLGPGQMKKYRMGARYSHSRCPR